MSKTVYILGSGFSKALSDGSMPTLADVGEQLRPAINQLLEKRDKEYMKDLADNPELLLTYLAQNHPWKSEEEYHEDRALFYNVAREIADQISRTEAEARQNLKNWGSDFIELVHDEKATVITFNYDALVEWQVRQQRNLSVMVTDERGDTEMAMCQVADDVYVIPLTPFAQRRAGVFGGMGTPDTFRLLKLHGSIHWFYSGSQEFPGEELYFIPLRDFDPSEPTKAQELLDRQPIIIPPVAEKSGLYKNQSLRFQWQFARDRLKEAEEVLFFGYSLPPTDLTVKNLLLTTAARNQADIYVADTNPQIEDRYGEIFGAVTRIDGGNPIERLIQERLNQREARRMEEES